VVNWGAFSRDFVRGYGVGAEVVQRADKNALEAELARKAESRAQGRYDQEMKDVADSRAALALEFGGGAGETSSVAQKAAEGRMAGSGGRSRAMAIPNKLGGPVEDGLPVPQSPEQAASLEATPEADEAAEDTMARERGYEPAAPSRLGARAPGDRARYGDNPAPREEPVSDVAPARTGGIPSGLLKAAASGNKAAAARVRQLQDQARADAKDQRDFNERRRVNQANINTSEQALTEAKYKQALTEANGFSQQAMTLAERLRGKENMPVTDASIEPLVTKLVDTLEQGYARTPDGRSIKVDRTPAGISVTTIDDRTGKPIGPPDLIRTVADLQDGAMMFGQIAQGENFGKWIASTSGDAIKQIARGTRGEAEVSGLVDSIFEAPAEERLNPAWQAQMKQKMQELEAKYPDIATKEVVEEIEDPDNPGKPLLDDRGRVVTQKERVSRFREVADLLQPNTRFRAGNGQEVDAQVMVEKVLADPTAALRRAGGSVQQMLATMQSELEGGGLDPEVASVLVQQAAARMPEVLKGQLMPAAMPMSTLPPQEQARTVGPQGGLRAREPGAPSIYERRAIPPVNVDPRARQIGSPFNR
jgi:hypothetical protein